MTYERLEDRERTLFRPFPCRSVNGKVFPLSDSHDNYNDALVVNLVNQSVAGVLQLDLIAIGHAGEPGRLDAGTLKPLGQSS
jgi:hypothetical protein